MSSDHVPTQGSSRDARRQSLLDAARALFSRKGYHATTVDDITRQAGVAKGTFYLYFGEKREIYHEVVRGFLALATRIGRRVADAPDSPAEFFARAEAAVTELVELFISNIELARLAYRESMGLDPALGRLAHDFFREAAEIEARNVQLAADMGILRAANPRLVAHAHIGMFERVLLAVAEAPEAFPPVKEVVDQLMELAYDGLRAPDAPRWRDQPLRRRR